MKILRRVFLNSLLLTFLCFFSSVWAEELPKQHNAASDKHDRLSERLKIKNRAQNHSEKNNGHTLYQYTVIDNYDPCTQVGESAGNVQVQAKNIYNLVEVKDRHVRAFRCPIKIGNIRVKGASVQNIVNYVDIQGQISTFRQPVKIGGVTVKRGTVKRLNTSVTIKGDIRAR